MASMSLDEARKILGEEMSTQFSDDHPQKVIWDLEYIARETLESIANGSFKPLDDVKDK